MSLPDSCPLIAFVGTTDVDAAKTFYAGKLGLKLTSEDGFALVFDVQGTMLRVTSVEKVSPAGYTILGWEVTDITAAAAELQNSGVALEIYPGIGQDESGIWTAPVGGARVAWFKDPDGNVLSISQQQKM